MNRDPRSLAAIEYSLWCVLACQCARCGAVRDLGEFDDLLVESPINWAKHAAPDVHAIGWSAPGDFELLCPACTQADSRL